MYKILVNGKEFDVVMENTQPVIRGSEFNADVLEYKKGKFNVIRNKRSFNAELISFIPDEKKTNVEHTYYYYINNRFLS